jgi:hypothetical protein
VPKGDQLALLDVPAVPRKYHEAITASANLKGCMDVDTVKGCTMGMAAKEAGCYGECYAAKIATRYGLAFNESVLRGFVDQWQHRDIIVRQIRAHPLTWYRIGVMGDPSHAWDHTISVIKRLRPAEKTAVIVTKHWKVLTDDNLSQLLELDVVFNTSTSGLDTDAQTKHRVGQYQRLQHYGIRSVNRVVTCKYGDNTEWARESKRRQDYLLGLGPVIDTPLRASMSNPRVISGEILVEQRPEAIGGGTLVSLNDPSAYLKHCGDCPDQCGALDAPLKEERDMDQTLLFEDPQYLFPPVEGTSDGFAPTPTGDVEFRHVESVIGSGFEAQVAALALEDGIAHRAARKNMQIHSAIICLIGGEFAGFMTFQDNRTVGEFCLLQSVIRPDLYTDELYREMVEAVIKCNTAELPMMMTTNPKSKFETPKMFQSLGFETYLKASGFEYMLAGDAAYHRLKTLAHITMTNVWNSTKGDWLRLKKEWNERIDEAGVAAEVANPAFATREGCWQGEAGFANVVTGRSHNGNASVLDPVACEVILRMFTPLGGRVYNPFGGGVQFGFIAGASGYEYLASEIRQNQCDANNALCAQFESAKWVQADSSTYAPDGEFDLVFACPPYYRVEKYIDYDGKSPEGEINALSTYDEFRDTLFAGYRVALEHLKDNRFIVIMTGDSRDSKGAYHCHEAETELFFKEQGLTVYNKIIYLEAEFTRLAQAKKTLNYRKFPKAEQRIIVAYKGKVDAIASEFPPIGRL